MAINKGGRPGHIDGKPRTKKTYYVTDSQDANIKKLLKASNEKSNAEALSKLRGEKE